MSDGASHGNADEGLGSFWERKVSTWVMRVDLNKDGVISQEEFEWLASRYHSVSKCSEERMLDIRNALRKIWKAYFEDPSKEGPITAKVYCDALRKFGKEKLVDVVTNFFPRFFELVDTDNDGKISLNEYRQFLDMFGMDPNDAEEAFAHLDTNHDGILTKDEFLAASLECYCGNDESSPYQYFGGKLLC